MKHEQVLSRKEAAERLQVSVDTVARLIALGELTAIRIGRAVRIPAADLDRLLRNGANTRQPQ